MLKMSLDISDQYNPRRSAFIRKLHTEEGILKKVAQKLHILGFLKGSQKARYKEKPVFIGLF